MATEDMKKLFGELDELLKNTDISDVTADSTGFTELPEGYYLCEVEASKLTESKSTHKPMASFQFNVVENGLNVNEDDEYDQTGETFSEIKSTKGRKIFVHYVFKDDPSVKRFVTDMLKFEGETPGESLLPKEAFISSETVADAIEVLEGSRIYIQISNSEKDDGTISSWRNLVSWTRASKLGLPV